MEIFHYIIEYMYIFNAIYQITAHIPVPRGVASDPLTGGGAYVSGSGGVEASRFTGKMVQYD